jgi:hypothetical protein
MNDKKRVYSHGWTAETTALATKLLKPLEPLNDVISRHDFKGCYAKQQIANGVDLDSVQHHPRFAQMTEPQRSFIVTAQSLYKRQWVDGTWVGPPLFGGNVHASYIEARRAQVQDRDKLVA